MSCEHLIQDIARDTGLPEEKIILALQALRERVLRQLSAGGRVDIPDFCSFRVRRTNQPLRVIPYYAPRVVFNRKFIDQINN